ncbi:MAG: hypothetical protein JOZ82_00920 [Marmoricola sp.]|nr:hypothetical protein [Marmoricola sp.]
MREHAQAGEHPGEPAQRVGVDVQGGRDVLDGPRPVGELVGEAQPRCGVQGLLDLETGQQLHHLDRGRGLFHGVLLRLCVPPSCAQISLEVKQSGF